MTRVTLPRVVLATLLAQAPRCERPFCREPATHYTGDGLDADYRCDAHAPEPGRGFECQYAWAIREAVAALKGAT